MCHVYRCIIIQIYNYVFVNYLLVLLRYLYRSPFFYGIFVGCEADDLLLSVSDPWCQVHTHTPPSWAGNLVAGNGEHTTYSYVRPVRVLRNFLVIGATRLESVYALALPDCHWTETMTPLTQDPQSAAFTNVPFAPRSCLHYYTIGRRQDFPTSFRLLRVLLFLRLARHSQKSLPTSLTTTLTWL